MWKPRVFCGYLILGNSELPLTLPQVFFTSAGWGLQLTSIIFDAWVAKPPASWTDRSFLGSPIWGPERQREERKRAGKRFPMVAELCEPIPWALGWGDGYRLMKDGLGVRVCPEVGHNKKHWAGVLEVSYGDKTNNMYIIGGNGMVRDGALWCMVVSMLMASINAWDLKAIRRKQQQWRQWRAQTKV